MLEVRMTSCVKSNGNFEEGRRKQRIQDYTPTINYVNEEKI